MSVGKMKWGVGGVLVVAVLAVILWQHRQTKRLAVESVVLRDQLQQAADLHEKDQELINRLKTEAQRSETDRLELLRLRAQASKVRQTEQENAQLKAEHDRLAKQAKTSSAGESEEAEKTPEQKRLTAKLVLGRNLGLALLLAAEDNNGQLNTELPSVLARVVETLSPEIQGVKASQFEVLESPEFSGGGVVSFRCFPHAQSRCFDG